MVVLGGGVFLLSEVLMCTDGLQLEPCTDGLQLEPWDDSLVDYSQNPVIVRCVEWGSKAVQAGNRGSSAFPLPYP